MPNNQTSRNDADFDKYFRGISQYVATKTAGMIPDWEHIPRIQRSNLIDAYSKWYDAYSLMFRPHNKKDVQKKTQVRKTSEKMLDRFINDYLHAKQVTNMDRRKMDIPSGNVVCMPYPHERDEGHHLDRRTHTSAPWHNDWNDFSHHGETTSAKAAYPESTSSP